MLACIAWFSNKKWFSVKSQLARPAPKRWHSAAHRRGHPAPSAQVLHTFSCHHTKHQKDVIQRPWLRSQSHSARREGRGQRWRAHRPAASRAGVAPAPLRPAGSQLLRAHARRPRTGGRHSDQPGSPKRRTASPSAVNTAQDWVRETESRKVSLLCGRGTGD